MEIDDTLIVVFIVIFNYSDMSSQFDCLPNGEPIPGLPHYGRKSSSNGEHSFARYFFPVEHPVPNRSRSSQACANRPSPNTELIKSSTGQIYKYDQLEFIRLTFKSTPHWHFELRRYTFPADKKIRIRAGQSGYKLITTEEKTVLSTFDGDVFATLENVNFLAGIYVRNPRNRQPGRAKINIEKQTVTFLTHGEIRKTTVGANRPILMFFKVEHVENNLQHYFVNTNRITS